MKQSHTVAMRLNEAKYRDAEQLLWRPFGLQPTRAFLNG